MGKGNQTESLLTCEELSGAVHGTVCGLAENLKNFSFTSVATDSRNVVSGTLFCPLIGEFQDGHKYIPQAIEKGATVIFITKSVYDQNNQYYMELLSKNYQLTFITVDNNLKALQDAARAYAKKFPNLVRVSVTGSSGKTTTKEICASILRQKYNLIATVGNFNSETGLPLSVFNIRSEHECGLFEMGMNRENEIGEIARVFKPNYAIVTNIGTAHIGILGSRENIAQEKKKIFSYVKEDGAAIIPQNDDFRDYLAKGIPGKVVFFGKDVPESESGVKFIEDLGVDGTRFSVDGVETVLKIPGSYNYQNALGAIALAKVLGLTTEQIVKGIEELKAPEGRSNIRQVNTVKDASGNSKKITILEDCYNANPDSMESAIEMCSKLSVEGKKYFILGDMFELGATSVESHSRMGALAAVSTAAELIFVGRDMKNGAETAKESGKIAVKYFENIEDANLNKLCDDLMSELNDGDFIFVKASHGMHLEKIIEKIVEESDEN
ncbi:MAG: UDP-N-acetylmuramoyl-tripeptide--D-alanyl-D-alanine ligase [Treponema sp.]|nr:UDP-N-acetylmuramoyl-tripeptide--D-alanyl-D-alanine ligase [Candidatus Treponema scatequi]